MKNNACIITFKKIKQIDFKLILAVIICILFCTVLLIAPNQSTEGAVNGLLLCGNILIPAVFPFCVISVFIIKSKISVYLSKMFAPIGKYIFNTNGSAASVIFLSAFSGYPVGAKLVKTLYDDGKINKSTAQNMLCCCVNAGPAFIILAVGAGVLGSIKLGYLLFFSSTLSSMILNIIFKTHQPVKSDVEYVKNRFSDVFVESVADSSSSILNLCGWVILFSAFMGGISHFLSKDASNLFTFLCEVTSATIAFRKNIYLVSAALGWGGICVHAQVAAVAGKLMPNYLLFSVIRMLHGALNTLIIKLLVNIFNIALPTASARPVYNGTAASLPTAIALLISCLIFLYTCRKNTIGKLH